MAMNKKEKQLVEDLKIKAALRWTSPVEIDVPIPSHDSLEFGEVIKGYSFNSYCRSVDISCSSSMYHNLHGDTKTTSQQPIEQHSTKLLALKAMRHEVEKEFAKELYKIDLRIEEEEELAARELEQ